MKKAFLLGLAVGAVLLIPLAFGIVAAIVPLVVAVMTVITLAPFYTKSKSPYWCFAVGFADTAIISLGIYMTLWHGAHYIGF